MKKWRVVGLFGSVRVITNRIRVSPAVVASGIWGLALMGVIRYVLVVERFETLSIQP
jgi:hypothetical protein